MRVSAKIATCLLALTPVAAHAQMVFTGADDGAPVGGIFTNSDAAFAAFFGDALPYSPLITNGFSTFATGYSTSYSLLNATLTVNDTNYGVGYSGINDTTYGNLYGFDVGTGTGKYLGIVDGSATFAFNGSTHAFGFYATGVQTIFGTTFEVTYANGTSKSFAVPVNGNGGVNFFGVVDPVAFSSITIYRPGIDAWGIDNVSYGFPAAAVPEPASWAMMIGGFAFVGAALRRRRYNLKVSLA